MRPTRGKPLVSDHYGLQIADLPVFDADDPEASRLDPREWFPHPDRRLELEIGSGKGTFLIQQAAIQTGVNFLGCEWSGEFYRYAADRIRRHELENVRMLKADAVEFVRFRCADAVAAVIHLYFSDPWPKKRHHKRRVVSDRALAAFHRILVAGGELRIVTDHDDLWTWCEEHAESNAGLFERRPFEATTSAAAGELVGTNYERKFTREGRPFHAMTLVKR
jgi:tRNA (guanine-N7-)-methyltransferase